jgi:hypothetical protein
MRSSKFESRSPSGNSSLITSESIISLIDSITSNVEEKVLLEDNVRGIIREAETLDSYICDMAEDKKKKLLLAYSKILEEINNNINKMLRELG